MSLSYDEILNIEAELRLEGFSNLKNDLIHKDKVINDSRHYKSAYEGIIKLQSVLDKD